MRLFYLAVIKIVDILLPFVSAVSGSPKLKALVSGRKKPFPVLPEKTGKRYWFHCASLGEFEQARPVMERLKSRQAACSLVVSFFSPSGYEQKHDYALADAVIYLPSDTPSHARKLLDHMQPDIAVFVKYEIWYYHLSELFKRQIPVYLVSATFRQGQYLFSFWGRWLFKVLPRYETIFLQDSRSYELMKSKGLSNIILGGDTRYDRVKQNALNVKDNEVIRLFKGGKRLIILGSSWPAEEDLVQQYLDNYPSDTFKILIVPHDISPGHINEINRKFKKYQPVQYTNVTGHVDTNVMILNTIGHLASAYAYADIAFIGGAFGKGLHNILEPLAFGVPVIFGPHYKKYPEASKAMEYEVAISIRDLQGLKRAIELFSHVHSKEKCIDFINWNSGATDLVIKKISA